MQALAFNAYRRDHWWNLHDVTSEMFCYAALNISGRKIGHIKGLDYFACRVESVCTCTKSQFAFIGFVHADKKRQKPCCPPHANQHQASGVGIESARVTNLAFVELLAQLPNETLASNSRRLIDQKKAMNLRRLATRHRQDAS